MSLTFTALAIKPACESYIAGLQQILANLPKPRLESVVSILTARSQGRVFAFGNGGSYGNAQLTERVFSQCGFCAIAPQIDPGSSTTAEEFENSFSVALKAAQLTDRDTVIVFSGSGNSPNIIKVLEHALEKGAVCIAFGGRDGGKMRALLGGESCVLAQTESMEALEDANLLTIEILAASIREKASTSSITERFINALASWQTPSAIGSLSQLGADLLNTALAEGTTFFLGADIGSRHLRGDSHRGWSNTVPIRGFTSPEFFTDISGTATANDDGLACILADGLAKYLQPTQPSFALLVDLPGNMHLLQPARELLRRSKARTYTFAQNQNDDSTINCAPLIEAGISTEAIVSLAGHMFGTVFNSLLTQAFDVQPFHEAQISFKFGRKPSWQDTENAEKELRAKGLLSNDRVLTFAYGKVFSALDPEKLGYRRVHY